MKVYVVDVDPNDYDNNPYVLGVYQTYAGAENAITTTAIENNEPALILEHERDSWEMAECYHYPDYEMSRYYIREFELE